MTDSLGFHCGRVLSELALEDERIWALDGDLADSNGAIEFARSHRDRFIMAGIAEQSMVSIAAGMASCGLRPFAFSFSAFLCFRALDQIRVCLSCEKQPVTLIGSHSGGCTGRNGKTHAAVNDIAVMSSMPNINIWAPATQNDVRRALQGSLDSNNASYIRLPRSNAVNHTSGSDCAWLGRQASICLVSTGLGTSFALETQRVLEDLGIDAGVLHCPRVLPLPVEQLTEFTRGIDLIYVIEDHTVESGLFNLLRAHKHLPVRKSYGWEVSAPVRSGSDSEVRTGCRLDARAIASDISATMRSNEGLPRR